VVIWGSSGGNMGPQASTPITIDQASWVIIMTHAHHYIMIAEASGGRNQGG